MYFEKSGKKGQVRGQNSGSKEQKSVLKKFFLFIMGGIIGFINGFLGSGGGMICVPALERFLKLPPKKAHATAIAVIFPISLFSAFVYVFNGAIKSQPLLFVSIGVLVGGVTGSFLLKLLPTKAVCLIFSILMIVSGVRLII